MLDQATRLASYTPRWRLYVRDRHKTPPFDSHQPVELRALTAATALDLCHHYFPHLDVVTDASGNPCISRQS